MLTTYQRHLFSQLVDLNWEANNTSNSYLIRDLARNAYWEAKQMLIDDMGKNEYESYVEGMRQMFAPAK